MFHRVLVRALVAVIVVVASSGAHAAERPNIVHILVDDLGWGDLSCYGQSNWETPRIDRMAAEGMLFTQAYAGSTVCAPSRAALLIGDHTGHLWQRGNGRVQLRPDPADVTVAARLKRLGYRTAMIGKSGVACNSDDTGLPNAKGFDHFFGVLSHVAAHRNYPGEIVRNGERIKLPGNRGKTGETYANELYVREAERWIRDNAGDAPFFLHLAITPPHADLTVPERYMAPFRGRFDEKPVTEGGYHRQPEPRAAYAGMIAFIDEAVGRVLDAIDAAGQRDATLVIFASDNGPHYEGGAHPDHFDSNGPLRGGKRAMFEGGIRTPQVARWPGVIAPDSRTDHITAFWDFPPTAVDLAGGEPPAELDGLSLAPLLRGDVDNQPEHEFLYWEFYEQGGKQAVRMGDWKGIRRNVHKHRDGPIELYNLATDLGETTDIAGDHPDIVQRIRQAMDDAHTPSPIFKFRAKGRP